MKTISISALVLALITAVVLLSRDIYVKQKLQKLANQKYEMLIPLIEKLESKEEINKQEMLAMVKDPSLRCSVYRVLKEYNQTDLFPAEYYTFEKGAEGFLVNWLEFPTELGNPPHEIEFVTIITIYKSEPLDYYVFKYKMKMSRWSGHSNWMLGISGPYLKNSQPYDVPLRVFSRFKNIDHVSAEHEAMWVHQNIRKT
jgi:hypothetical protein